MKPNLLRVLVVEDDFVQALQIADVLADMKCEVVGPLTTMHQALQSLSSERLDAIVTDLDLNGRLAFPLTRAATQRGVPIAVITAYSPEFSVSDAPVLEKPCSPEKLRTFLASFLKGVERKTPPRGGTLNCVTGTARNVSLPFEITLYLIAIWSSSLGWSDRDS